jgi:hypothetical protein
MRASLVAPYGVAAALAALLAQSLQPLAASGRGGPQSKASLDEVVRRMSQYVLAFGAQASMFVGAEHYTQRVEAGNGRAYDPRRLVSEFAIVKAENGDDWVGYRDVVEVNEKPVVDRRDRLLRLLTAATLDAPQLKQIVDESARYNIGPVIRNFNVPTTVLYLLQPGMVGRFSFERKGTKEVEGVETWVLEFKETARPTVIRTREGHDVAARGRVWVVPGDGTVVRTRLELRNFADQQKTPPPTPAAPTTSEPPPTSTRSAVGGSQATPTASPTAPPPTPVANRYESLAIVEVSYQLDKRAGAWLPLRMSETYEGAIPTGGGREPFLGRATGLAEYSGFKRFETSAKILVPK